MIKVCESTLKTFLSLLEKGRVYGFLLAAFFVNISTPSSLKNNHFLIVWFSFLQTNGKQAPLKNPVSEMLRVLAKQNRRLAVLFNIKNAANTFLLSEKSHLLVYLTSGLWQR